MTTHEPNRLVRHLIALALSAPATTAIAVAIVLPLVPDRSQPNLAGLLFCFGSLVGYCVELAVFLPLYALIHRRVPVSLWSVTAVGALAGALPAALLNTAIWPHSRDPIEFVLSPPGLAALGALGGAIYWLLIRETGSRVAPLSGFSGSHP